MSWDDWGGLDRHDLAEIRRRARIMERLSESEPVELPGADVIGWQSYAGDAVSWVIPPSGEILLLVFDHESELNLYPEYEVDEQARMYEGVPERLVSLVRGRADEAEFTMMGDGDAALPAASGVFWCDADGWHVPAGLAAIVAERDLDIASDTGVRFCLSWYRFDGEFTVEALLADDAEERWGVSPAELTEMFAAEA